MQRQLVFSRKLNDPDELEAATHVAFIETLSPNVGRILSFAAEQLQLENSTVHKMFDPQQACLQMPYLAETQTTQNSFRGA